MFKKIPKALIEKYNLVVVNKKKLEYGFSEYPTEDTHLLWHVEGECPWRMASDVYFSVNQLKWCYYSTIFINNLKNAQVNLKLENIQKDF